MKARFYIDEDERTSEDPFIRPRKNFECVINAAMTAKEYNNKCVAYQLLGGDYETVKKHLKKSIKKYEYRNKYKLVKTINSYSTIEELIATYHYKNLKLEKIVVDK